MTTIIFGILEEGLVYAIMALGVYITYKILDFPDLSVDGTFPLGAALTAGLCRPAGCFSMEPGTILTRVPMEREGLCMPDKGHRMDTM